MADPANPLAIYDIVFVELADKPSAAFRSGFGYVAGLSDGGDEEFVAVLLFSVMETVFVTSTSVRPTGLRVDPATASSGESIRV